MSMWKLWNGCWQSIEMERGPYKSGIRAEMSRREEEKRRATKKQKKAAVTNDAETEERIVRLEARVHDGEGELQHLKQEMRSLLIEVIAFRESCSLRLGCPPLMEKEYPPQRGGRGVNTGLSTCPVSDVRNIGASCPAQNVNHQGGHALTGLFKKPKVVEEVVLCIDYRSRQSM
jgi:hypothetical protein